MYIGLYFGSFNPIHVGHLIIAQHCLEHTDLKEIWLVVSPQNPFKASQTLLNEQHRLRMVQVAIENEPRLRASNIEFKLPKPSYTIHTLTHLKEKYPQHKFAIIMGSDGFQNIDRWKNGTQILNNYDIYVYPRPGAAISSEGLPANVIEVSAPLLNISSTHIRKLIGLRKSIRYLVTDEVKEEIEKNHYYQSSLENPAQ
jgi:nicotinate-nucleotide adenylyltransferase